MNQRQQQLIQQRKKAAAELRSAQLFQCYQEIWDPFVPKSVFAAQNRIVELQYDRSDSLRIVLRVTSGLAEGRLQHNIRFDFDNQQIYRQLLNPDRLIYTEKSTSSQSNPVETTTTTTKPAETIIKTDSNGNQSKTEKAAETKTETTTAYLVSTHESSRSQWYNEGEIRFTESDRQLLLNSAIVFLHLTFEKSTATVKIGGWQLGKLKHFLNKNLE